MSGGRINECALAATGMKPRPSFVINERAQDRLPGDTKRQTDLKIASSIGPL